jgi:tetratricopeptide (TPR) repeat protein
MRWPFRRKPSWNDAFKAGWELGTAGNIEGAIEKFRTAIELAPTEPYPHYQLGYSYMLMGRYADAVAAFKQVERLRRGFFISQTYCYMCEGRLAGTISRDAFLLLQRLLNDSQPHKPDRLDTPDGLRLCGRAIELAPLCPLGHYYQGKALFFSDPQASEAALRLCLALRSDDTPIIDALLHIGSHRWEAGDVDTARMLWQGVLDQ